MWSFPHSLHLLVFKTDSELLVVFLTGLKCKIFVSRFACFLYGWRLVQPAHKGASSPKRRSPPKVTLKKDTKHTNGINLPSPAHTFAGRICKFDESLAVGHKGPKLRGWFQMLRRGRVSTDIPFPLSISWRAERQRTEMVAQICSSKTFRVVQVKGRAWNSKGSQQILQCIPPVLVLQASLKSGGKWAPRFTWVKAHLSL